MKTKIKFAGGLAIGKAARLKEAEKKARETAAIVKLRAEQMASHRAKQKRVAKHFAKPKPVATFPPERKIDVIDRTGKVVGHFVNPPASAFYSHPAFGKVDGIQRKFVAVQ